MAVQEQHVVVPRIVAALASKKQKHVKRELCCSGNVVNLLLSAETQMGTRCPGATR